MCVTQCREFAWLKHRLHTSAVDWAVRSFLSTGKHLRNAVLQMLLASAALLQVQTFVLPNGTVCSKALSRIACYSGLLSEIQDENTDL